MQFDLILYCQRREYYYVNSINTNWMVHLQWTHVDEASTRKQELPQFWIILRDLSQGIKIESTPTKVLKSVGEEAFSLCKIGPKTAQ